MAIAVAILVVTFSITCMCSLLEACVLSLRKAEIAGLGHKASRLGDLWMGFRRSLAYPLGAILIVNGPAKTRGRALAARRLEMLHAQRGVFIASLVMAVIMIQWGEI